ncbi:MAG: ShlB/FhaC/HecB family hemolysin secretion/activation protein [Nitrospinales bacterium]
MVIEDGRERIRSGQEPTFFVKRIEIEGNTLFDDATLAPLVDVGQGAEMTFGDLAVMVQEISVYYSMKGYFLVRAYIPKQEIKDGVVRLVVNEGRIANIQVRGNKKIKSKHFIDRLAPVRREQILSEHTLKRTLNELNDLLGVRVRSVLRPGDLPGTSDLILEVTETSPYTFGFNADNFGSRFTGRDRFGVTGSVGNILTLGDQFYFRGVRSNLGQNLGSISYLFPFTRSGRSTFKVAHTYSEQQLGANLSALNAGGQTNIFNVELGHALVRTQDTLIRIRGGFESKDFRNFRLGRLATNDEIRDVYFGIGGNISDRFLGRSFFDLKVQRGISGTDLASPLPSRALGDSTITLSRLNLTRFQGTGFMNTYFIFRASGQITSSRVLSPDQFAVGGFGTTRGFPLAERAGDWGLTSSAEYFIPFPFKVPLGFDSLTLNQVFSFTGFIEHGQIFVRDQQLGEKSESITGVGWGVQINIPPAKRGWRPPIRFAISQGFPIEGPSPSDGSSNTLYLNGAINFN